MGDQSDISGTVTGGTILQDCNVYSNLPPPTPPPADDLNRALALLETLPLDAVPTPGTIPGPHRLNHRPNKNFVGRQEDFLTLAKLLKGQATTAIGEIAVATGLGGMGKTQLAVEIAHRYGQFFAGGVFFLSFAERDDVPAEVAQCGPALGFGTGDSLPEQVARVLAAWQSPLPRLLIFDNCEDESLLADWLPPTGGARVLVTARRGRWSRSLGVVAHPVGVLSPAEAIALLLRFRPDLRDQEAVLQEIAAEVGHLPLALHLAGSYLAANEYADCGSPEVFLEELRQAQVPGHEAMQHGDFSPTAHDLHVGRSFAVSFRHLDPDNPTDALARHVLFHLVCFAPGEPIPRKLFKLAFAHDDSETERALRRLITLGLIEEDGGGAVKIHRLVAAFAAGVDGVAIDAARDVVEIRLDEEAIRTNESGLSAALLSWQPHLREVAEMAARRQSKRMGSLLNSLGFHFKAVASFAEARVAYERALAIAESEFGLDSVAVAGMLNNQGNALRAMEDLDGAQSALERALRINERECGKDHPKVADTVNNLGGVLLERGDLDGAGKAFGRALGIREHEYGPDHIMVATPLNNLGTVLHRRGDLEAAQAAFERTLRICEAYYKTVHPKIGLSLANLGDVLRELGDLASAEKQVSRAADIFQRTLVPNHPWLKFCTEALEDVRVRLGDIPRYRLLPDSAAGSGTTPSFSTKEPASMPNNTYDLSGAVNGGVVIQGSTLTNVGQIVGTMTVGGTAEQDELKRLVAELRAALAALPAEHNATVEEVAKGTELLVAEAAKPQDNGTLLKMLGNGLLTTAKALPTVVGTVEKIVGVVDKFRAMT